MKKIIGKIVSLWRKALNWVKINPGMDKIHYWTIIHMRVGLYNAFFPIIVKSQSVKETNAILRHFTASLDSDETIAVLHYGEPYPILQSFQPVFDGFAKAHFDGTKKFTMRLSSPDMEVQQIGDFRLAVIRKGSFADVKDLKEYTVDFLSQIPLRENINTPFSVTLKVAAF